MTDETVSRIERGAYEPAVSTLHAFAEAMRVTVDDLISGTAKPARVEERSVSRDVARLSARAGELAPSSVRILVRMAYALPVRKKAPSPAKPRRRRA